MMRTGELYRTTSSSGGVEELASATASDERKGETVSRKTRWIPSCHEHVDL